MAIQLKIDEMLEVLHNLADTAEEAASKIPKDGKGYAEAKRAAANAYDLFAHWAEQAEELANQLADVICEELDVEHGPGEFEGMAFAGLCVPFYARIEDQPLPDAMQGLDNGGEDDWGTQGEEARMIEEYRRQADELHRRNNPE